MKSKSSLRGFQNGGIEGGLSQLIHSVECSTKQLPVHVFRGFSINRTQTLEAKTVEWAFMSSTYNVYVVDNKYMYEISLR